MAAVLLLLWSFGQWNPPVAWLIRTLPLLRAVRYPAKFLLPACIAALPLFWSGVQAFCDWTSRQGRSTATWVRGAALALLFIPLLLQHEPFDYLPAAWDAPLPWMAGLAASGSATAPPRLLVDPRLPVDGRHIVDAGLVIGSALPWGLKVYRGPEATASPLSIEYLAIDDFAAAAARANFGFSALLTASPLSAPLAAACQSGDLTCTAVASADATDGSAHWQLLQATRPPERWALLSRWQQGDLEDLLPTQSLAPSLDEGQAWLGRKRHLDTSGWPVFTAVPRSASPVATQAGATPACARMQQASFRADYSGATFQTTASCPSLLAVNLRFTSGWRASVDGRPTPIGEVNGRMLGLELPAGAHAVTLAFAPPFAAGWLPLMLACQALAIFAVAYSLGRLGPGALNHRPLTA